MSPLFLEFLMGRRHLECTPWGMPAYSIFGWQKPCYLMQEGYADTFQELLDSTDWRKYGYESGNPKCANCMMHSGYEASAVDYTFSLPRRVRDRSRDALFAIPRRRGAPANREAKAGRTARADRRRAGGPREADAAGDGNRRRTELAEAVEEAFDYRGDVTIELKTGERLEGYIFDREPAPRRLRIDGEAGRTEAGRELRRDRGRQLSPVATWRMGAVGKPGCGSTPSARPPAKAISSSCPKRSIS